MCVVYVCTGMCVCIFMCVSSCVCLSVYEKFGLTNMLTDLNGNFGRLYVAIGLESRTSS